jgi:CHAT domain-containing protein
LVVPGKHDDDEPELLNALIFSGASFQQTRLVVLSACSSAQGADGSFNSSDAFARTLVSSGVPQVIASRWPVNSASTSLLMKNFYDMLRAETPATESLRSAQKKLREEKRWNHPFYWAAFAVFGKM